MPENLGLLDQDTLKMILTFMKASSQVEQLLVQFEEDVAEVAVEPGSSTVGVNQTEAEAKDDIPGQEEEQSMSLKMKDRGSLKEKEPSTSRKEEPSAQPNAKDGNNPKRKESSSSGKGKERESSGVDRNARDSVKDYQQDPPHLVKESKHRVKNATQQDTPKEVRGKSESRISGSSSGASKASSRDQVKEEKRGNRRDRH